MTEYFPFASLPAFCRSTTPSNIIKPRRQRPVDWPAEPFSMARGETALWAAVITQALMDALSGAVTAEAKYFKHEAAMWLTGNSRDFRTVCECAGFDPGYVRRMAKRALISPRKWRADPGQGNRYLERREYRRRMKNPASRVSGCTGSGNDGRDPAPPAFAKAAVRFAG